MGCWKLHRNKVKELIQHHSLENSFIPHTVFSIDGHLNHSCTLHLMPTYYSNTVTYWLIFIHSEYCVPICGFSVLFVGSVLTCRLHFSPADVNDSVLRWANCDDESQWLTTWLFCTLAPFCYKLKMENDDWSVITRSSNALRADACFSETTGQLSASGLVHYVWKCLNMPPAALRPPPPIEVNTDMSFSLFHRSLVPHRAVELAFSLKVNFIWTTLALVVARSLSVLRS